MVKSKQEEGIGGNRRSGSKEVAEGNVGTAPATSGPYHRLSQLKDKDSGSIFPTPPPVDAQQGDQRVCNRKEMSEVRFVVVVQFFTKFWFIKSFY